MYSKLQDGSFMICGYVAKDAEKRTTQNGGLFVTWGVAVGKKNAGGNEETVWTNCKAFGRAAEIASGIVKGDTVLCVGKLETTESNGKTYKNLNCEYVSVMAKPAVIPQAGTNAANQTTLSDLDDYEDILSDGDVPF